MNIEGLTLKLLTDTLNEELLGSKIYKVYMPNPQSLLLLVRRTRDTSSLLADMHNGSCVLYLPQQLPETRKLRLASACFCASIWRKDASRKSAKAAWTALLRWK